MNITLISLERELFCYGIRILSACLREKGHRVKLVFLVPPPAESAPDKFTVKYPEELLDELAKFVSGDDLVGISLMTNQFIQSIDVTKFLKSRQIAAPIIWGGIQPTVEPRECLQYADMICVGEGEEALLELVDRMEKKQDYTTIRNLWIKTREGIIDNPVRPLVTELDRLPLPDYSCEDHYYVETGRIAPLTKDILTRFQGERFKGNGSSIAYMTMTSRGCPFNCTYCANSVFQRLYPKQKLLRWRSQASVIRELKMIRDTLAPISYVYFVDDNFTARPNEVLKAFCDLYKAEVNVPFFAQVSPLTNTAEKMEILFNSGCAHVTMGVETASKAVAKLYNRSREHEILPQAIALVEKYRPKMNPPPAYQFIIDNPYETLEDTLATLRLAMSFPRPWHSPIYSLMLFPGVALYDKALKDGIITDKFSQIYGRNWRSQSRVFFQIWIRMYLMNLPPFFLKMLLHPWIARIFTTRGMNTVLRSKLFRRLWIKY